MAQILLFDPEPDSRELLKRVFERAGHTVNAVEEIEECVRIAAGEPKDLAALHTDYQLGIELAQKLKAVNKSTAVLLIANYIPGNDHAAAIDDLLPKPMDIETVESKAEEILEGRARCVRSALQ